jgi:hypothetical protein
MTDRTPEEIARAILAELKRQCDDSGLYIYGDDGHAQRVGLEGWVDLEALAAAILQERPDADR